MNLINLLREGHTKAICNEIVAYIGTDKSRFSSLIKIFLAGPYRITQRAAWPLSICVQKHPDLVKPHLKPILLNLKKPGAHDAVKRNTIRLLQFIEIPKPLEGLVADICFGFLNDRKEPIAVRVFSMSILGTIAGHHPELKKDLILFIEEELPLAKPAFLSRGRKVLRSLKT